VPTRSLRLACRCLGQLTLVAGAGGIPQLAHAQRRDLWPQIYVARVGQDSPTYNEVGWQYGLALPVDLTRFLGVTASFDLTRTHLTSGITICYVIDPDHNCLRRHANESVLTSVLALYLVTPGGRLRPFIHAGGGISHSLAADNPGERRDFFVPQGGLGLLVGTAVGTWALQAHWRQLDRWFDLRSGHQIALALGFRSGR
jgi:hypothetical protein